MLSYSLFNEIISEWFLMDTILYFFYYYFFILFFLQLQEYTERLQPPSSSALSTIVACHRQGWLWRLDVKDKPSFVPMAMAQYLVEMIFGFLLRQIPTAALLTWTTVMNALWVRMLLHFLQELRHLPSKKWKFLVLKSKRLPGLFTSSSDQKGISL